ncbi:MAG: S8 family serine peptidase, partial [bacterium]
AAVELAATLAAGAPVTAGTPVPIDDPLFPQQWHLSTSSSSSATTDSDLNAPEAWSITMGDPQVRVAVIDSGVMPNHPDLNVIAGYNAITGGPSLNIPDLPDYPPGGPHGTSVAGVIAAKANNAMGVAGVAPGLPILSVKLIAPGLVSDSQIFDAFQWATDHGAWIINNSWGIGLVAPNYCLDYDDHLSVPMTKTQAKALDYAITQGRGGKGCVIVFAAGNDRASADGLGMTGSPFVLTVAASNNLAMRSFYSNYGWSVDVAAPSDDPIFFFPDIPCAASIWTGGTLGITTTAFFDSPSDPRPVDPSNFLLEGVTGYYDISLNNAPNQSSDISLVDPKWGAGFLITPVSLTVDGNGSIAGVMEVDTVDLVSTAPLRTEFIFVTGKVKYKASGTALKEVKYNNSIKIKGNVRLNDGGFAVPSKVKSKLEMSGKEKYSAVDPLNLFAPGFTTKVSFKRSVSGPRGISGSTGASGTVLLRGFKTGYASFQSSDLAPTNSKNTSWKGSATLDADWGTTETNTGGDMKVKVSYPKTSSNGTKAGKVNASANLGKIRASANGPNWVSDPDIEEIDGDFSPTRVTFTTPGASTSITYPAGYWD